MKLTTGWVAVDNGDTTQLDLSAYQHLEAARIKWKGDRKRVYSTATASGDAPDYPAVPSAYIHHRQEYNATIEVTNLYSSPGTIEIEWTFNYEPENYVAETEYVDIGANETIYLSKSYETYSNWVGVQCGVSVFNDGTIAINTDRTVYAKTIGYKYIDTQNPSVTINGSTTTYSGTLDNGEISAWQSLSGLAAEQINDISHSIDSSGEAEYQIEYDVAYPVAPERISPTNQSKQSDKTVSFEITLTEDTDDPSSYYHAKIMRSLHPDMSDSIISESKESQSNWEYYDTDTSIWEDFPGEGVAPGTKVRYTTSNINYGKYYWRAQTWSTYGEYGYKTSVWNFTIKISTKGLYSLVINSENKYDCYNLNVVEASNGEIGSINFEVKNANNTANSNINYRDEVLLAVNDSLGNQEQFKARVREKNPSGNTLTINAITGDGILSERIIDKDYTSQDIGLIVKDIIDDYCSPLTSNNINTATGIITPVEAIDKKPIKIFEDLRRRYGIYYFVDKDWDVHFYVKDEIELQYIKAKRGD